MALIKILKITGAVLGAVIVSVVLYLLFADLGKYKPKIEEAVTNATGREFRIDGDLEIKALPRPYVRMENVTLANAPWAAEPNMLEVGQASVKVGLWSLLFGPVVVHDFQLHDVTVLAEANADEEFNWQMGQPSEEPETEEEPAEGSGEPPVELRAVDISNVSFVYRQPDADDFTASIESLTLSEADGGAKSIDGLGQLTEWPLTVAGTIDDMDADIEASLGDVQYRSQTHYEGGALDFDLALGTLENVGKLVEVENLPVEELTLTGNIGTRGDTIVLTDVVAGIATASLTINGELDGGSQSANLSLTAEAEDFRFLIPDFPEVPFAGTAEITMGDQAIEVDPFDFTFGESDLSGSLRAEGGDTPTVTLQATSSLVDLRPFQPEETAEGEETEEAPDEEAGGDESQYVFKDEPLPVETLQKLNADINVSIARIVGATSELADFELIATVMDGVLDVENRFKGSRGGDFENLVQLATSGGSGDLTLKASAENLKLALMSGPETPDELVPTTNFNLDITATGGSPRQLASSANGKVLFTQGPGRVKNELIGRLSGDIVAQVFSALNPFAKDEEYSNWECTIFALDFESGMGEITGFLAQGEKLMIVGGGEIDLTTEEIGIEFNTKPRSGVGVSADMFVTPFVAVTGTLSDPGVGLNAKGALLSGGLAVMTGGMSFLYQGLMDRATAEADRCAETLAEVGAPQP